MFTQEGQENNGQGYSLDQGVAEFMSDVNSLEEGGQLRDLNLLGGQMTEQNRQAYEDNKAKRQLATEGLLKIMGKLYIEETQGDDDSKLAFMISTKQYLQGQGLRDLNEIYLLARGGDKLLTTDRLRVLFGKMMTEFKLKQRSAPKYSAEAVATQQAVKSGVGKAMRLGLELDEETRRILGVQQASDPTHFARKVGTQSAFPMHGRRRGGRGADRAA
jgi:hypothetical protein